MQSKAHPSSFAIALAAGRGGLDHVEMLVAHGGQPKEINEILRPALRDIRNAFSPFGNPDFVDLHAQLDRYETALVDPSSATETKSAIMARIVESLGKARLSVPVKAEAEQVAQVPQVQAVPEPVKAEAEAEEAPPVPEAKPEAPPPLAVPPVRTAAQGGPVRGIRTQPPARGTTDEK